MGLSTVVALLQAALMLLTVAQGPNVSQSLHDQAVQVANQAITLATAALSSQSATQSSTQAYSPASAPNLTNLTPYTPALLPQPTPSPTSATLTASPTSGAAPLTVSFTSSSLGPGGYMFNAGDEYYPNSPGASATNFSAGGTVNLTHTYSVPGTYSAALTDSDG
jgi:PKD repeat protein